MDTICINNLAGFYRVGVSARERVRAQRLLVTIEMAGDFSRAATQDDLRETIDYEAVSQRLLQFAEGRSWKLIETLAAQLAEMILAEFGPQSVCVEVKKFVIPAADYVSVKLTRSKTPGRLNENN